MSGKRAKENRRHTETILVSWLHSLLNEEEGAKINIENYKDFLPKQTHFYAGRTLYLNAYHPQWIVKKIVQIKKIFPHIKTEDITLELIQWKAQRAKT